MAAILSPPQCVNILRPRQNGCYFADNIFKCIFLNENVWISIEIPLKFVPKSPINNILALNLFKKMAWRQSGDKPLSEQMMVSLLTHICVTRLQWIKSVYKISISMWRVHIYHRDHSGYELSQWEMPLQCNVISHWLNPYPEWSLYHSVQYNVQ